MSDAGHRDAPVPFHTTPEPPVPFRKRILLVSGHFPPSMAVGGLRWQKMSQVAAERGWGTDVICADPATLAETDPERLVGLPPGMRMYGVPRWASVGGGALEALVGLNRRLRGGGSARVAAAAGAVAPAATAAAVAPAGSAPGSIVREDALRFGASPQHLLRTVTALQWIAGERRWARRARAIGAQLLGPEHRVIVTSGPPHFAHEAGRLLARRTGLPHVVDMRDPWSLAERVAVGLASPAYFGLVGRYERRSVESAALVVCNTELATRAMRATYPAHAERIVTIMNGSDDDERPDVARDPRFLVAYAGAIYFDRDPRLLFRASARVIAELGLAPADYGVEIMGPVDTLSPPVMELARQEGIEAYVRYHPPGPRSASARLLASASMLVSLPQDTETAVPSKVFEYASYDAWLLALARPHSATALVLEGTSADVVAPDDVDAIAEVLRRHLSAYRAGERPTAVGADGRFSRRRQAALLLDRIDALAPTR